MVRAQNVKGMVILNTVKTEVYASVQVETQSEASNIHKGKTKKPNP